MSERPRTPTTRRRSSLGTRLLAAFLAVAFVSVLGVGWLVDRTVRRQALEQVSERLQYEVTMTGQMTASALFGPLAHDDTSLKGPLEDLSHAVHTQLSVLTADGFCVADAGNESGAGSCDGPQANEPEIVGALANGHGSAVRGAPGAQRLWVAETVVREGKVLGIARASVPMGVVDAAAAQVRHQVIQAALFALALAAIFGLLLSFQIAAPVRRVAAAARRIGGGELSVRVEPPTTSELGDLASALNEMASDLDAMMGKLRVRNADMRRVLDNVEQGLFVASLDGTIEAERSARVDEWFGAPDAGTRVWDLCGDVDSETRASCQLAWEQLQEGFLGLDLLIAQLPARLTIGERVYAWRYAPIKEDETSAVERILVTVSDITESVQAERREREHRDLLGLVNRVLRDRAGALQFLAEADRLVVDVGRLQEIEPLARALHTLKGGCAIHGLDGLAGTIHEYESLLEQDGALGTRERDELAKRWRSLRGVIDAVVDARAGVVVEEADLAEVAAAIESGKANGATAERVRSWARTPVEALLGTLGDRAQAIAAPLGKAPLVVRIEHDETRVDRERYGALFVALSHAVRNAIVHGIEPASERASKGKAEAGELKLRGRREGEHLVVEVADDGAGIAWDRVAARLEKLGQPAKSQAELEEGLFVHGMSTAAHVNQVAGRGVGLGALRETVKDLGGTIRVVSEATRGTTITCRIPERSAPARHASPGSSR